MRESVIERSVSQFAKQRGWLSYKWLSTNNRGLPDRIFIKDGNIIFVEFKAPGEKPTPLQSFIHKKLNQEKIIVHVIDTIEAGKQLFA